MKEYICDKCKRKIEGNTYYTVDIYGNDINPTNDNRVATDTATQNITTNLLFQDYTTKRIKSLLLKNFKMDIFVC